MASANRSYDIALARLNAYIKAKKLRASTTRNKVLEKICRLRQPFTAEQLTEACAEEIVSLATIYNALTLFVSAQIIHASHRQRGSTVTEYELITGSSNRLQIICTTCGKKSNFHDNAIERQIKEHQFYKFDYQHFSLFVYGECNTCKKKKQQTTK